MSGTLLDTTRPPRLETPVLLPPESPGPPATRRRLPRSILLAMLFQLACAVTLLPVAGQPYDLSGLTGAADAWLRWGVPLTLDWKFGLDLSLLGVGAQALRVVLEHLGMSGAAALTTAWKLPLVAADLLTGLLLYDLGRRLHMPRPTILPVVWLMSPVVLWVAAGHGQVEPLSLCAIVLACDLVVRRRFALSGVVVGLGVGVEYLPVMVFGLLLAWLAFRLVTRSQVARFAVGLGAAVVACFAPIAWSQVGRSSLLSGLRSTAQATSKVATPGPRPVVVNPSVWHLFGVSPGRAWLGLFAILTVASTVAMARRAARTTSEVERSRYFLAAVGAAVVLLVVLDPGSLPQFALLTLGGLALLRFVIPINWVVMIVAPSLQLSVGFLYLDGGTFQSFWYDMWNVTSQAGWSFPRSVFYADQAGRWAISLTLMALAYAAYMRLAPTDRPPRRLLGVRRQLRRARRLIPGPRAAVALGLAGCCFLAVWSSQPVFWRQVGHGGPASLADWAGDTATRQATLTRHDGVIDVHVAPLLAEADRASTVHATLGLDVRFPALVDAQRTGAAVSVRRQPTVRVQVPSWPSIRPHVSSLWVSLLLGDPRWRTPAEVTDGRTLPELRAGGRNAVAVPRWLIPGWVELSYPVPADAVSPSGLLDVRLGALAGDGPKIVRNAGRAGPWVVIDLRTARVDLASPGRGGEVQTSFPVPTPGSVQSTPGVVALRQVAALTTVRRVTVAGVAGVVTGASLAWPRTTPITTTLPMWLLDVLGVAFLLGLVLGGLAVGRWLTGRSDALPGCDPPR